MILKEEFYIVGDGYSWFEDWHVVRAIFTEKVDDAHHFESVGQAKNFIREYGSSEFFPDSCSVYKFKLTVKKVES